MIKHFLTAWRKADSASRILALLSGPAIMLVVFHVPLFSGFPLFPPVDGSPFFPHDYQTHTLGSLWGAWDYSAMGTSFGAGSFVPATVLAVALPPLIFHVVRYMFGSTLLGLATAYFLRGHGFRRVSLWLPSIAMALSGYTFTLISAGHSGFFDMMPFAVFVFGCLDRAVRRRSFYHFGWAGVCAGFGLCSQPDVMALFGVLAVAYGLFLLIENRPCDDGRGWAPYLAFLTGGAALALALAGAVAYSSVAQTREAVAQRDLVRGQDPAQQWEYATNWSMPPEELVELAAPFVYGIETGDVRGPYWGRLGRAMRWGDDRQGLMNLKQHTLYMGVFQLLLALYGVVWFVRRPRAGAHPSDRTDQTDPLGKARPAVLFWTGAFVLAVLLAMGRFTPLYRLFYSLPLFWKIRAPVKFIHLAELALAVLFAYGLAALLRDASSAGARRKLAMFAAVSAALALTFGTAAATVPELGALQVYWQGLGFPNHTALLARVMRGGLGRATFLFALAAATFTIPLLLKAGAARIVAAIVWIAVSADMATVGRKYVRTGDVRPWYNPNPVAETILADTEPGRAAFFIGQTTWRNWVWGNLAHHGVDTLQPRVTEWTLPEDYQAFFGALQKSPLRLWEITNTRYVIGPRDQIGTLASRPDFETVMPFELAEGRYVAPRDDGRFLLLRFRNALPRASVFHHWTAMPLEAALERLDDPDWNPHRTVLVSADIAPPPFPASASAGTTRILRRGRTLIDIETDTSAPGILLLNDKYDPDWRARVNGKPAAILRCNTIMRGVMVPQGVSRVQFTYRPNLPWFLLSLLAWGGMVLWWAVRSIRAATRRPALSEADALACDDILLKEERQRASRIRQAGNR